MSSGLAELSIPADFILHHSSTLLLILGGILILAVCLLQGMLCRSRLDKHEASSEDPKAAEHRRTRMPSEQQKFLSG